MSVFVKFQNDQDVYMVLEQSTSFIKAQFKDKIVLKNKREIVSVIA